MITQKWIICIMILCLPVIASAEDTKQSAQETDLPEGVEFIEYDTPPQPVGGFKTIQQNLQYPEADREAGTEGRVIIYAKVNTHGDVIETKVIESVSEECDVAAIKAIKMTKWEPATKDDQPLSVWIAIPIQFKLH